MRLTDFQTLSYQATIWVDDYNPGVRPLMLLATTNWAARFDGEPSVMPSIEGFPSEVPRFNIASVDRRWKLQDAERRVNLFWERKSREDSPDEREFVDVVMEVLRPYLALSAELRVSRMAYLAKRFSRSDEPAMELTRYFCRKEILQNPLKRPENFELHAHKTYQPEARDGKTVPRINSWVRWKAAWVSEEETRVPGILVEQDLNTLADVDAAYSNDDLAWFFSVMSSEAESILQLYLGERT